MNVTTQNPAINSVRRDDLLARAGQYGSLLDSSPPIPYSGTVEQARQDNDFFVEQLNKYQEPTLGELLARVRGEQSVHESEMARAQKFVLAGSLIGLASSVGAVAALATGHLGLVPVAFGGAFLGMIGSNVAGCSVSRHSQEADTRSYFADQLVAVGNQIAGVQTPAPAPPAPAPEPPAPEPPAPPQDAPAPPQQQAA